MSRTIFIGDVHGCITELKELIKIVKPTVDDGIIFIGDLIHKGPASEAVLDYVDWLDKKVCCTKLITGNHEEKHLRWLDRELQCAQTGQPNPMKHVEDYAELEIAAGSAREHRMVNSWIYWRDKQKKRNWIAIHGGIPPMMTEPLFDAGAVEALWYPTWKQLPAKHRKRIGQVLRTRYVNPQGKMVALGSEKPEDTYWADIYDGRYGFAIFGHQPFDQATPRRYPHAVGIDQGCIYGGWLMAYMIDHKGRHSYQAVKAKQAYAERTMLGIRTPRTDP